MCTKGACIMCSNYLMHSCKSHRYASLYFCCAIEQSDNELLSLEIIHRYVELLDKYFGSVSQHITPVFVIFIVVNTR